MSLIFLDFDGVLNSRAYFDANHAAIEIARTSLMDHMDLDPACIARVDRICEATDADVVVSSSWRHGRTQDELAALLIQRGSEVAAMRIVGMTPRAPSPGFCSRGAEIAEFLRLVGTDAFIAIDDDSDLDPLPRDRWILTDPLVGITDADVDRAVAALRKAREGSA